MSYIKLSLLAILMILVGPVLATTESLTAQQWIRDHVAGYEEPFLLNIDGNSLRICPALVAFYHARDYELAWSDGHAPLPRAESLVRALSKASREGLNPADYQIDRVKKAITTLFPPADTVEGNPSNVAENSSADPVALAKLDVLLSQTFLHYAAHLGGWRVDQPNTMDPEWFVSRPFLDLPSLLTKAIASDQIEETLVEVLPTHPDYIRLREFLVRYQAMATTHKWPRIPDGSKLSLGSRGSRVSILRARLAAEDFLPSNRSGGEVFDEHLRQAVRSFQRTHGLEPDGKVGSLTREVLNVPISDRIRQIETNLERWRWMPRDLGRRHIMVNVAGYELEVVDDERTVMTMRVVVGKPYLRTPVFSAEMSYLVINPYWNVPPTIAGKEILPELRRDPGYLTRHNMEVNPRTGTRYEINPASVDWSNVSSTNFPFRLRQRPGQKNPLGTVKFMLPNRFNVYLHDTSQRSLFARTERVFSHGCIRVENPIELMEYVLGPKSRWNRKTLKTLNKERERVVGVPQPIPVHILYWTAWVDNDGKLQFRKDVYGRDKLLEASRIAPSSANTSTEKWANHLNAKQG